MKSIEETIKETKDLLELIRTTNDAVVKETDNLRVILINLKIQDAHIKENTGIVPIANARKPRSHCKFNRWTEHCGEIRRRQQNSTRRTSRKDI